MSKLTETSISGKVIGCAIEVHTHLGPGLLESVYEECLARELYLNELSFKRQLRIPLKYKGVNLNSNMIIDLLVEDQVVVEIKSVEKILEVHKAQLLTYMKLTGKKVGLLINFNVPLLKDGINRFVL